MQIVIDIPEGFFEEVRKDPSVLAPPFLSCEKVGEIIANGKPLPKGHGRLIDADAEAKKWGLDKATKYGNETAEQQHFSYSTMMMYEITDILDDADVIIEADGGEKDAT